MWFNNPDKDAGEKGYYSGDLIVSPSVVTISRSGAHQGYLTLTSPDGKAMTLASLPWDDISPYMGISMDLNVFNTTGGRGVSLPMFVEMWNVPANGTYVLHATSAPVNPPTNDSYRYDGFITVNVVD